MMKLHYGFIRFDHYRVSSHHELKGVKVFYDLCDDYSAVAVVGVKKHGENDDQEGLDIQKETVRKAVGAGVSALQKLEIERLVVDGLNEPEAAAEAVTLKTWQFNDFRNAKKRRKVPQIELFPTGNDERNCLWHLGTIKAQAQNLARKLTDTPANVMTPTAFAQNAVDLFREISSVKTIIRDEKWAQELKMNSFLSVSKGSREPPVFLEISYKGDSMSDRPVVLVGKGITFDTGGSNLKSTQGMADMRGDKGGAACVLATTYALALLKIPINVITLIPLCENIPGGSANKPGDIISAMNGKTVRIDNTDAEGRLILADALHFAKTFNPRFIVDVATLTGAMSIALGTEATGVFTNSDSLWKSLEEAGKITGDRVWRFPLWKSYGKALKSQSSVDLTNIAKSSGGGACFAAAFLREFVPPVDWLHLDIAGVMGPNYENAYLEKGMSGRPTRTLIEFLKSTC